MIKCLREYENNVLIKLSASARKVLSTKKPQTQTWAYKKKFGTSDRDMEKSACHNFQKLGHMTGDWKNLKQEPKFKNDRTASAKTSTDKTNKAWFSHIVEDHTLLPLSYDEICFKQRNYFISKQKRQGRSRSCRTPIKFMGNVRHIEPWFSVHFLLNTTLIPI